MKLCKFGGSSLASAEQIRKVCDIIMSDPKRKYIVVSAPGKRYDDDNKITDLLIALANAIHSGYSGSDEIEEICSRYEDIARQLGISDIYGDVIRQDLEFRIHENRANRLALTESLKAAGEDNCAKLLTLYLNSLEVEATYIHPGEAGLELEADARIVQATDESFLRLSKLKELSGLLIIPGFFGYAKGSKQILTFSRGGSDITGSIFAAALTVNVYENFSDVDGVYSVSPKLVRNPHPIRELTYSEMRELAYGGFSVVHEEALEPILRLGIPLNIRNTNNPSYPGTMIVEERFDYDSIVTGITGTKGFCALHFSKYLLNRETGFIAKVLSILADLDIPFEHMPSSLDSVSIIMKDKVFPNDKERIVRQRLYEELSIKNVKVERGYAIVTIVGDAMAQTVGVAARAVSALSRSGINIEFVVQASSEISMLFGVKEAYCNYAVTELYKTFYSYSGV
ncbi:MAG: aspartate kinase [Eubacteriales bacterium]|nr:aspartate kinase [Eubacteriales bacterium]